MLRLFIFICLSFSSFATDEDGVVGTYEIPEIPEVEVDTEAEALCLDFACIQKRNPTFSLQEVSDLCYEMLPDYCLENKDIKPEHLICSSNPKTKVRTSARSVEYCVIGIIDGVIDIFGLLIKGVKGIYSLYVDEEYRQESLKVASFVMDYVLDAIIEDEAEAEIKRDEIKDIITSPIVGLADEITNCLNIEGTVNYFCEALAQYKTAMAIVRIPRRIYRRGQTIGRGLPKKLRTSEKLAERSKLNILLKKGTIIGNKITPYQAVLLTKSQIKQKFKVSPDGNNNLAYMRKRQIQAIPLEEIKKVPTSNNSAVISKFSDKQFRAWATNKNIGQIPRDILETNIKRIDSSSIASIPAKKLVEMQKKSLEAMSTPQISALTPKQAYELNQVGKLSYFSRSNREIIESKITKYNPPPIVATKPQPPATISSGSGNIRTNSPTNRVDEDQLRKLFLTVPKPSAKPSAVSPKAQPPATTPTGSGSGKAQPPSTTPTGSGSGKAQPPSTTPTGSGSQKAQPPSTTPTGSGSGKAQ
ncbi:MAG: hypothetical protein OXC37_04495, partial [Bdellovibrionaceae bacterium]|nr:hypothetical protein [Pseudobdellovibrionaceae bacterium]